MQESVVYESQSTFNKQEQQLENNFKIKQKAKMALTFQILADLTNINAAKLQGPQPESQLPVESINETKAKLLSLYVGKIKAMDQYFYSKENRLIKQAIQKKSYDIEHTLKQQEQIRSEELYSIQKKLNSQLKNTLSDLRQYIQAVTTRIKHQRYLNNETQINDYLQRQKDTFKAEKGDLQRLIRNHDDELQKQYIKVALDVCKQKQERIRRLQDFNRKKKEELQNAQAEIKNLTQKQQQICKQNLKLSQNVLKIKARQQAELRKAQRQIRRPQNGQTLTSYNPVSQIMHSGSSQIQQSVISVPDFTDESQKPSTKCQIVSNDLKTQLQAKKMLIILIIFMSAIVSLW